MTLFDLLIIVLFLAAIVTLAVAVIAALRGRRAQAIRIMRRLLLGAAAYVLLVYAVTLASTQKVIRPGEPECNDDWCLAVERVDRTAHDTAMVYDVTLRIFSKARGRAQREGTATDLYLLDSNWNRYEPLFNSANIPLNVLLQPGESVTTHRVFEAPSTAHRLGLLIGRSGMPVCLVIGECDAFHKGTMIQID